MGLKYLLTFLLIADIAVHSMTNFLLYDIRSNIMSVKDGGKKIAQAVDTVSGGVMTKGVLAYQSLTKAINYAKEKINKNEKT